MRRVLSNPYLAILLAPLLSFLALVHFGVTPDPISLVARVYVFALFGYVGARYVGRAPVLMWQANTSPEALNVSGWSLVIVGSMMQQLYAWLYIVYNRPSWLASQYWSPSFVVLVATGLSLVAFSVPRIPPFGRGAGGLSVAASFIIGLGTGIGMLFVSHIPQIIAVIKGMWTGVLTAV